MQRDLSNMLRSAVRSSDKMRSESTNAAKRAVSKGISTVKSSAASTVAASKAAVSTINNMEIFKQYNPITWILIFNFALRFILYFSSYIGKTSSNKLKEKETKSYIKEAFGISLAAVFVLYYVTFMFNTDSADFTNRDAVLLALYFIVFLYDFVYNVTSQIKKQYFQPKKEGDLFGIYVGIILGLVVAFALLISGLQLIQQYVFPDHYNMFGKDFDNVLPIYLCGILLLLMLSASVVGFFIINPEVEKNMKEYKGSRKDFYIESFKVYYIVLFVILVLSVFSVEKLNLVELLKKAFKKMNNT